MNQRMRNTVIMHCAGGKLTQYSDMVIDLKQGETSYEFVPTVVDDENAFFVITKEQASALTASAVVKVQMLFTDENGEPNMTGINEINVREMLREEPYGN